MAAKHLGNFFKPISAVSVKLCQAQERHLHATAALCTVKAGKVKITIRKDKPVTYEDSFPPPHIAHRKSWNSWNTSTIEGGLRPSETAIEDLFIRRFLEGTFPTYILSKPIIKRQYNIIRVAFLINSTAAQRRLCFLVGYTETLLSYWLQSNVKLEVQVVNNPNKMIFKYV